MDTAKYDALEVPFKDTYGVLMHRDSPLSEKTYIEPEDLWDKPLILSRQEYKESRLQGWLKREKEQLNIVATYNLLFNGSLMVKGAWGMPSVWIRLSILPTTASCVSGLCFQRLSMGCTSSGKNTRCIQGYPKVPAEAAGGEDGVLKIGQSRPLPGSLVIRMDLRVLLSYAILKYV